MPPIDPLTVTSGCGATDVAQDAFVVLSSDYSAALPTINFEDYIVPPASGILYDPVSALTNEDLTDGPTSATTGDGTFDIIMKGLDAHLNREFQNQRITGDQYAKAYIELTTAALGTAAQYLLGRDQGYWQAVMAQLQARQAEISVVTAQVGLETAKAQLAITLIQVQQQEAEYALSKMKLATEDATFCSIRAQTSQVLLQNTDLIPAQVLGAYWDNQIKEFNLENMLPSQRGSIERENEIKEYQLTDILPAQKNLTIEQTNAARAQTNNLRLDGQAVEGLMFTQQQLYEQQIASYVTDGKYKVSKMYLDSWIAQKAIDEGLLPPQELENAQIQIALREMRIHSGLV